MWSSLVLPVLLLSCPVLANPAAQAGFSAPSRKLYLTPDIEAFVHGILELYGSPGLSVAVVRKHEDGSWTEEAEGYGIASRDGRKMTADTVHGIASNSKLFLATSVGLLVHNETLAEPLDWRTKVAKIIPEFKLMDEYATSHADLQDLLSHRTGMPRHDASGIASRTVPEMISVLRYLRPSDEFRATTQYNNLMYETLTILPSLLLNQTYFNYIQENVFDPLNMTSSTFSVAKAEAEGRMAEGFLRSERNLALGVEGNLTSIQPYFLRPGEEEIWAGAGGVLTSARDLTKWMAMLLNDGRHPMSNVTVVPKAALDRFATGATVIRGRPKWRELSGVSYGMGLMMGSYQGHNTIGHDGSNPGFKSVVSRWPDDGLAIAVLSNDEEYGSTIIDIVEKKLAEVILDLKEVNWTKRYLDQEKKNRSNMALEPPPTQPKLPPKPFLPTAPFAHPAYGSFKPCLVGDSSPTPYCRSLLEQPMVQPLLNTSYNALDSSPLTLLAKSNDFFSTFLRLVHFDGALFNSSTIRVSDDLVWYSNWNQGLMEWVPPSQDGEEKGGWAGSGNLWGGAGDYLWNSERLGLSGREGAEVFFESA